MVGPPDACFFLPLDDELIADEVGGSIEVGFGSRFASEWFLACVVFVAEGSRIRAEPEAVSPGLLGRKVPRFSRKPSKSLPTRPGLFE
jgi:hypothetical protein